jgi:hypothetical protein
MLGRSFAGEKVYAFRGVRCDRGQEQKVQISYTCVSLWQKGLPEGRMSLGEWISDDEGDGGGWVCAGEQGAVC